MILVLIVQCFNRELFNFQLRDLWIVLDALNWMLIWIALWSVRGIAKIRYCNFLFISVIG